MLQVWKLHSQAKEQLQKASHNPKQLALIHTAIALGASVFMTLINYFLDLQIENTGGLSGLETRSLLSTIQVLLELALMLALPFWQAGIFYAALSWARGDAVGFRDLPQGFRKFGSVLGVLFLKGGLFLALGIVVINIGTTIFMMTPLANPLTEIFAPIMEQGATPEQLETLLTPELMEAAGRAAAPLMIALVVLYIAIAIPLFYRVRFADFAVMEDFSAGRAILKSLVITRKNALQVCKLDLSFWWFYLLQALTIAMCYGDVLLPLIGISLPVSGSVAALLFLFLGSVCQTVLLWQWEAYRVTTYALAYRTLDGSADSENNPEAV